MACVSLVVNSRDGKTLARSDAQEAEVDTQNKNRISESTQFPTNIRPDVAKVKNLEQTLHALPSGGAVPAQGICEDS
ncbi:MAG: hypothetical protein CMJ81_06320 [Planctomycetaceae bacterium]|nr:hypothetical protein [Planctomycetaceae bacterium]